MKVFDLLQEIEEILDSAGGFPLTGKVIVDPDDISDILKEIKRELPEEFREAQWLSSQRERIIADAEAEYERIVKRAAEQADQMVEKDDITLRAKKRADEIMQETEESILSFKQNSFDYVQGLFDSFQKKLNELNSSYCQKMYEEITTTFQRMDLIINENKSEIERLKEKLSSEASEEARRSINMRNSENMEEQGEEDEQ